MTFKTVGVLGGMGPAATLLFFRKLVQQVPAKTDQEHLPVIIYNNPQIPDRTAAILGQGESPVPALRESLTALIRAGAQLVCMPCNTAHYFVNDFIGEDSPPFINMLHVTAEAVASARPRARKVGLLATKGTLASHLYQTTFALSGIEIATPAAAEQEIVQEDLYRIKAGKRYSRRLVSIAGSLVEAGADCVVLGCTELSLIATDFQLSVPVWDPMDCLAHQVVQMAVIA